MVQRQTNVPSRTGPWLEPPPSPPQPLGHSDDECSDEWGEKPSAGSAAGGGGQARGESDHVGDGRHRGHRIFGVGVHDAPIAVPSVANC